MSFHPEIDGRTLCWIAIGELAEGRFGLKTEEALDRLEGHGRRTDWPFAPLVGLAVAQARRDIAATDMGSAAREIHLLHGLPFKEGSAWKRSWFFSNTLDGYLQCARPDGRSERILAAIREGRLDKDLDAP